MSSKPYRVEIRTTVIVSEERFGEREAPFSIVSKCDIKQVKHTGDGAAGAPMIARDVAFELMHALTPVIEADIRRCVAATHLKRDP